MPNFVYMMIDGLRQIELGRWKADSMTVTDGHVALYNQGFAVVEVRLKEGEFVAREDTLLPKPTQQQALKAG